MEAVDHRGARRQGLDRLADRVDRLWGYVAVGPPGRGNARTPGRLWPGRRETTAGALPVDASTSHRTSARVTRSAKGVVQCRAGSKGARPDVGVQNLLPRGQRPGGCPGRPYPFIAFGPPPRKKKSPPVDALTRQLQLHAFGSRGQTWVRIGKAALRDGAWNATALNADGCLRVCGDNEFCTVSAMSLAVLGPVYLATCVPENMRMVG